MIRQWSALAARCGLLHQARHLAVRQHIAHRYRADGFPYALLKGGADRRQRQIEYGIGLLQEAGLPADLWQVVCGPGPVVGPAVVGRLREELANAPFGMIESLEVLQRTWHVEGQSIRPDHRMVAHTGFLTHARLLARESIPTAWGDLVMGIWMLFTFAALSWSDIPLVVIGLVCGTAVYVASAVVYASLAFWFAGARSFDGVARMVGW